MIVACTKCGKKYTVDEKNFKQNIMQFKCRACGTVCTLEKPVVSYESVEYSEDIPVAGKAEKNDRIRFGLFPKTIILMLLISLVPVGLLFMITYNETGDRVKQDTQAQMEQATSGLMNHIDEWVDKNKRLLHTAARLESIKSLDAVEQTMVLRTIHDQFPWMYLVFTLDINGMNTARNDGKALKDYSDRAYFRDIINGKSFSWQTLIGKTSKKPALVLAVPITAGGEVVGVLAAAMTTETISQSVAKWTKGKTGFAFLVDENNKVIAHQVKAYVLEEKSLSAYPVFSLSTGKTSGFGEFTDMTGELNIAAFKKNELGWNIVVQQGKNEAYETLLKFQRYILLVFFFTIAIVAIIAWFSARSISKPILEMTDAATRMSLGDLDVEINIESRDEIGMLAKSIVRMQTSLAYAMKRLKKV
ncbi:cache domain-containing protein [uncultured Desulfobacter sp.]|uniref:cache domain-containing protein n=1 Tax=uncultured Desulfobacter sp. TaxID=240139 RepID=UPI002D1E3690|nr:cache domain-containing protein [uncultured Desulfobacter sp.]